MTDLEVESTVEIIDYSDRHPQPGRLVRVDPGICDRCKHWLTNDGICKHPKLDQSVYGRHAKDRVDINGGIEQDDFNLYTGPRFGCVHWESNAIGLCPVCHGLPPTVSADNPLAQECSRCGGSGIKEIG
ncbi:MAG: hypothetical protein ACTSYO_07595 [Candidatus Ranarchaeia archaeon]